MMFHRHHFSIRNSDHTRIFRDYSFRSTDHVGFYSVFAPLLSDDPSDLRMWTWSETPVFVPTRSPGEQRFRRMSLGRVCWPEVPCSFLLFWIREELSVLEARTVRWWSPRRTRHFSAWKRWFSSLFEYSLVSQHHGWWHLNHWCDDVIGVYDDDELDVDQWRQMNQSKEERAWNRAGIGVDWFRYPG